MSENSVHDLTEDELSDWIDTIDRAWRAIDSLGGYGESAGTALALDTIIRDIEGLGGMDPAERLRKAKAFREAATS